MKNAPRKIPANLSIRADLLEKARGRRINLSKTLEERLLEVLSSQDRQAWQRENREAIVAANRLLEDHGLWSDGLRSF